VELFNFSNNLTIHETDNSSLLRCDAVYLGVSRRFEGPHSLHLQELRIARGTPEDGGSNVLRNIGKH
jgi:hypothetical protein